MEILYAILIITAVGFVFGIILSVASVIMHVPVDEKVSEIRACLPGANCGACGYSGCDGYAEAIASGEAEPYKCTPGGTTTSKALSDLLGVEIKTEQFVAVVGCNHGNEKANRDYLYEGRQSCSSAKLLYGGQLQCKYGCLGFGDCANVCNYEAIKVVDGVAKVDRDKCVGCAKCAKICPSSVISLIPYDTKVTVNCHNLEKGAISRKKCAASCIGCMKCTKVCETGAISVENFLAHIDTAKCSNCGKCAEVCPQKCIIINE